MNDTSRQILSIKTLFNLVLFRDSPEILGFLHHSNQRFQLLWSKPFELFHNVSIIIQLQEPRIELHLLRKRDSGMSEICCKKSPTGMSRIVVNASLFLPSSVYAGSF